MNVIRSHSEVREGRWRSINANAVHGQSMRNGFWVEDSDFDAVGDDVMNFYTVPSLIVGKPSVNSITVASVNIDILNGVSRQLWKVGYVATFVDPVEGRTMYEARVTAMEDIQFGHPQLTFDRPVNGVRFATGPSEIDSDGFKNDTAVYNSSTAREFLVQGSTLSNARRYGQFVMADDVQLVDSTYFGLSIQGNEIYSPLGYPEPSLSDRWIGIDLQFNQDVNVLDNELFSNVELIRELHSEMI